MWISGLLGSHLRCELCITQLLYSAWHHFLMVQGLFYNTVG